MPTFLTPLVFLLLLHHQLVPTNGQILSNPRRIPQSFLTPSPPPQPSLLSLRSNGTYSTGRSVLRLRGGDGLEEPETEKKKKEEEDSKTTPKETQRRRRRRRRVSSVTHTQSSSTNTTPRRRSNQRVGVGGNDGDRTTVTITKKTKVEETKRKQVLASALEKDAATVMGDAIRDQGEKLLQDDLAPHHLSSTSSPAPSNLSYSPASEATYTSLRYSLGSSSFLPSTTTTSSSNRRSRSRHDEHGGGVDPSPSAVLANYFLKSHGGAHSIQSLASLGAVLCGMAVFVTLPSLLSPTVIASTASTAAAAAGDKTATIDLLAAITPAQRRLATLLRRTLSCALAKHSSGVLALACLCASRLPEVGWRETRRRLETSVEDPVAQYLCYCALLVLWIGGGGTGPNQLAPWWMSTTNGPWNLLVVFCIIGPVLLREVVSTLWVISDVLVLLHSSRPSTSTAGFPAVLRAGQSAIDMLFSLLLLPATWRDASPPLRQRLLARLVGRTSLLLEVGVGCLLTIDAMRAFGAFSFASVEDGSRPSMWVVGRRMLCARLYLNFMLVRRRKIVELVTEVRGGARHVPGRVLDVLLDPKGAMGLDWGDVRNEEVGSREQRKTRLEQMLVSLGF